MEDQTKQEQASPAVRKRVQDGFNRQGLMTHLGGRLAQVSPGGVRIVLPARPEVTQQHGYVHAGATSAVADSAGGYAASRCSTRTPMSSPSNTRSTFSRPPPATTSKRSAPSWSPDVP